MSTTSEGSARTQTVRELGDPLLEAWEGRLGQALDAFACDPEYLIRIATNSRRMGDGLPMLHFIEPASRAS